MSQVWVVRVVRADASKSLLMQGFRDLNSPLITPTTGSFGPIRLTPGLTNLPLARDPKLG
jgi:hypothetical protein